MRIVADATASIIDTAIPLPCPTRRIVVVQRRSRRATTATRFPTHFHQVPSPARRHPPQPNRRPPRHASAARPEQSDSRTVRSIWSRSFPIGGCRGRIHPSGKSVLALLEFRRTDPCRCDCEFPQGRCQLAPYTLSCGVACSNNCDSESSSGLPCGWRYCRCHCRCQLAGASAANQQALPVA